MTRPAITRVAVACAALLGPFSAQTGQPPAVRGPQACFLLYEVGVGETRRAPADACRTRLSPQSTFKIPHALVALDAGILADATATFTYDGSPYPFETWRRDHTLASAMHYSALWYFQRLAIELGASREREYLKRLDYGNADATSGLTTFWIGGSLAISPEEQARFLLRLYADALPLRRDAMRVVRETLVQPRGKVINARGEHPFAAPWPDDVVVSAKTGSGPDRSGRHVRWLVGHVSRGSRSWVFVSCVIGRPDLPALAAVELAEQALRAERVL